nr:MAG TPA: hypothetical protein [Bacteriophage sp.]
MQVSTILFFALSVIAFITITILILIYFFKK